jgi:translocation protein SEC66
MVDWLGLAVPFAYLGILIGSLATFSSLYRKRKAAKATSLTPWFPFHLQRDIYFSLLHLEPTSSSSKEKKSPAIPETVLKAALLRRATEVIDRVMVIREQKQALALLLQRGSVGDDLWQRFLRAEKETEDEFRDVVNEANSYAPNWGHTIFQSAKEMASNSTFRQRIEEHQSALTEEREWWNRKKTSIQEGFMKELEQESTKGGHNTKNVSSANAGQSTEAPAVPSSTTGSDDDAVLVESGGPAVAGTPTNGGSKKKKKGKK